MSKKSKTKTGEETKDQAQTTALEPEVLQAGEVTEQEEAFACKDRIETAAKNITTAFVDLAVNLAEAYRRNYAVTWGYDNFETFVTARLDMKYRRAMYLTQCGQAILDLNIDKARVEAMGWTKFKEIAAILQQKPAEADKYLAMAESKSSRELQDEVRKEMDIKKSTSGTPGTMRLSLKFDGDAMAVVSDAIRVAKGEIGKDDIHDAVNHICAEWLMAKGAVSEQASLDDWLAYMERTFGVRLQRVSSEESLDALLAPTDEMVGDETNLEHLIDGDTDADVKNLLGV